MDIAEVSTSHETDFSSGRAWRRESDELTPPTVGLLSRHNTPTVSPLPRPRHTLPVGVTAHVISSTDTSEFLGKREFGSTGIRRKNVSGHNLLAEATRASGAVMATQMKDMADASRGIELSKMEVQHKQFTEHMQYQRGKDIIAIEHAKTVNEIAKLAIEKQGEIVKCLTTLSLVMSAGMQHSKGKKDVVEPHTDPASDTVENMLHTQEQCCIRPVASREPSAAPQD